LKFPQTFIDEVRSAADIVTVISDTVSLRKAGTSYKGLCPFHGEKTPSFNVNRDRGFFHCFGCGVGGDVFKFVELQEKVGFQEAVRHLAGRFGIPIPELDAGGDQRESAAEREAPGARAHGADHRPTPDRLRPAGAGRAPAAPAQGRLPPAPAHHQRPGVAARRWQ
jgi:DNA primase catalytic core